MTTTTEEAPAEGAALTHDQKQAIWDEFADEDAGGNSAHGQDLPNADADRSDGGRQDSEGGGERPTQTDAGTAAKSAEEDKFAALLARIDGMQQQLSEIPKLQQNLRVATGRVAALQSELDKSRKAADPPMSAVDKALSKKPDKWEHAKREFPDIAEGAEQLLREVVAEAGKDSGGAGEMDPAVSEIAEATNALVDQVKAIAAVAVEQKHAGWQKTIKTDAFREWHAKQPPAIQALGGTTNPADAIQMLDLFSTWKASQVDPTRVQETRDARARRAAGVPTGGGRLPVTNVDDMSPKQYWDHLAAKDRAKK